MKNVMIVEDQKMVRTLFESFIEKANGYHVLASLSSAYDSIEYCRNHEIDLILMDVQTDNRENGIIAVEKIKSDYPRIKIIVVTSLVDYEILYAAQRAKADSLWYKDGDEETLINVINRTMNGEHIFPTSPPPVTIGTAKSTDFTKTEMKVLRYLIKGLSYKKIADEMCIEVTTVKYHVANMLQKTNLDNKLQLALAVSDAKLIVHLENEE